MAEFPAGTRWDIFCRVVDNLGDIGVCWRLAIDLSSRHGMAVRLWVDDLAALERLVPGSERTSDGVDVRRWDSAFPHTDTADCVIEAFACELPPAYLLAMAQRPSPPLWINLEYLSAEDWVAGCHALPSPHPSLPLTKYFFFPGFSAATGGLLREAELLASRERFQTAQRRTFLAALGAPSPAKDALTVSLFAYAQPQLPALLRLWGSADRPVLMLVPQGRIVPEIAAFFAAEAEAPVAGSVFSRGTLTVAVVPFLPQRDYDRLLWCCDVNFVRGEDSFVRAQWAAHPFVWQIYVQPDEAHLPKLRAFLDRFCAGLDATAAAALRGFWLAWNGYGDIAARWPAYQAQLPALDAHGRQWVKKLASQADLTTNLVNFYLSGLK